MIIYGAGMAGLLAAQMLRRFQPVIHEAQLSLPHNHEALLRFRTDAVARATGIPFQQVEVTKSIFYRGQHRQEPTIQLNNLYSQKVTGQYHSRSISNLKPAMRYIAPPNFIEQMANSLKIEYGKSLTKELVEERLHSGTAPIISTVPMTVLMSLCDWPDRPKFHYKKIWSAWTTIQEPVANLYQTIYYPDPELPYYRASITGARVILEYSREPNKFPEDDLHEILEDFGITYAIKLAKPEVKEQNYGKLLPINDGQRRRFILALTDKYRIYSIGRFATWRQLLMDDVVQDVQRVEEWVTERDAYTRRLQG